MLEVRTRTALLKGNRVHPHYSRAERLADSVLHYIGVISALVAVPVMVTLAAVWYGDASTVGAASSTASVAVRRTVAFTVFSFVESSATSSCTSYPASVATLSRG